MTFVLNWQAFKKFTEGNARYLCSFLRMWRHIPPRLFSPEISHQLARGHNTIESHLKYLCSFFSKLK